MAVKRIGPRPAHNHPELVDVLAKELAQASKKRGPGIPDVLEQELRYGNKLQVTVIWDRWENVGHEERGPIILEAYRMAFDLQRMLQVSSALGVTPREAERLNIEFLPETPRPAAKSKRKKNA